MSNCINLGNNMVMFFSTDMDIPKFKALIDRVPNGRNEIPESDTDALCAWWYLISNCEVKDHCVTIRFGEGNSTHTWRDLRWLVNMIKPMMKRKKRHVFIATDESDGFEQAFRLPIVFGEEMK